MPHLLEKETIESIYESAIGILTDLGIEFELESARQLLLRHGAKVDGSRVFISQSLLEKTLDITTGNKPEASGEKRVVASSPFSNSPMIIDDATGRTRRGTIDDAILMYQLAGTSELYEAINPGVVDPEGNDSEDQYLGQVAMLLKYSDSWPSLGIRATKSSAKDGDVYASAKKAIQLIREIKESDGAVMGQGICPNAPLSYDDESLINLQVLAEEGQSINIYPCTLSYMTGPESLMGVVIHDLALSLAGAVYARLINPEVKPGFSNFSTMSDMRTMQPVYAGPEYLNVQIMFYEVCRYLGQECALCGCMADGARNDYQSGFESCFTTLAPFMMTELEELWCYPGHSAAFAGGSFAKVIYDEELLVNCNRLLQGLGLSLDPQLNDKLSKSIAARSFLTVGDIGIYRREQRISPVFDKRGLEPLNSNPETAITAHAQAEIKKRRESYQLPERSKSQQDLLQKHLPSGCKY